MVSFHVKWQSTTYSKLDRLINADTFYSPKCFSLLIVTQYWKLYLLRQELPEQTVLGSYFILPDIYPFFQFSHPLCGSLCNDNVFFVTKTLVFIAILHFGIHFK